MTFLIQSGPMHESRHWTDTVWPWMIVVVLLIVAVLIGYANFQNARGFQIESSTSLAPETALNRLQLQFAQDGWSLGHRDSTTLVTNIERRAQLGSTAVIGCLSVWLALLHVVSTQRQIVVQIGATVDPNGARLVSTGSRSGSYLSYVAYHINNLPKD